MKKIIAVFVTFFIIIVITFSVLQKNNITTSENDAITVITSLFPEYDFVKQIGKDKVNVKILLTPGTESHTYEPTPSDIVNINKADMFIYTEKSMEPWASKIANSIDSDTVILEAGDNINLIELEHDHNDHEENHNFDAHIWLDPLNAVKMVNNITDKLCDISPENSEYFRNNANEYIQKLENLDKQIDEAIKTSNSKKLVFGGEFAYTYFINRYNLEFATAYDGCGEGAEPSVLKIKEIVDTMNTENINVIFYQELSEGKIAKQIASETGAKAVVFHTAHNVTNEDLENGITYISIMEENLEKIKEAMK